MTNDLQAQGAGGLELFSRTNRLISHELKNVLAIISETLGLMDELMKAGKGGLTPEKFRTLHASIMEEVDRANSIIRNMNAFAHSIDEFFGEVDIGRTLDLMIQLSRLDSSLRRLVPGACGARGGHPVAARASIST